MATPDPYLPGHGDTRYRVRHYDLALDYKVAPNRLTGRATLAVVIAEPTTEIELDLYALTPGKVHVDGRLVRARRTGQKVVVPVGPREPGDELTLAVGYAGNPRPVPGPHGAAGWEELTDGVLVGSQPYGAPSWYPCNDDASDKATYRMAITLAKGYHLVANGSFVSATSRGAFTTWVYEMDRPMAPYLATVQIGRYTVDHRPGPVPVDIVHPVGVRVGEGTAFEQQVGMLDLFVDLYGPYPFSEYRVVITDDPLEIPLEAQGLSSFGRNFTPPTWDNERLVAHELSHQWFGNTVTARHAADIWLHEGFACYSEWLWSQHSGRQSTQAWARHHWDALKRTPQDLRIGAPGARDMFDDRVYKRGALTVHALRAAMGDNPFFDMVRGWTSTYAARSVSTADLVDHCAGYSQALVADILDAWLYQEKLPALPVIG